MRGRKKNRQPGQIIAKGERGWLVRVYAGRDGDGKRIYPSKEIEGTYKQAQDQLTKMLHDLGKGALVMPKKDTLDSYLESWLEGKLALSPKTRRDYEHLMNKHIVPALGRRVLQKLTKLDIATQYRSLLSDGLSARTVRYTHTVLSQALNAAVEDGLLVKNPAAGVELPSLPKSGGDTLSFEETAKFLDHNSKAGDRLHALWRLLLTAGLRPQEALSLEWSDLQGSSLSVRRALKEEKPGKWFVSAETKTGEGRNVTLSAEMTFAFAKHRATQATEILKQGSKYTRNDLIFATRTGHHFTPPNIRRWWKAALKAAGVREVRLYDTRHTNISHELELGGNPAEVAARHGHHPDTMMKVYAHCVPGAAKGVPQRVEERLAAVQLNAKEA